MTTQLEFEIALRTQPWAMPSGRLNALAHAAAGNSPRAATPTARSDRRRGRVAIIPVAGVLTQRAGWLSMLGMGTATQTVSSQIRAAVADASVAAIVLEFDSDGGSAYGIGELAAEVTEAKARKPIVAHANAIAGSGAYWLAASCTEVYCTPSGEVGGIGVVSMHADQSRAMQDAGVGITLISAGQFKTEGHPYGPLSAAAKDFMQRRAEEVYSRMTRAIASGRHRTVDHVRAHMGQGRMLLAKDAKAAGMVDGVCTLDELLADLNGKARSGGNVGASSRLLTAVALAAARQQ